MLAKNDLEYISQKSQTNFNIVKRTVEMLQGGMTVPFISRYRKEVTSNLSEISVRQIEELLNDIIQLNERKDTIKKTIEKQEKLSKELEEKINNCYSKTKLEDIYLPYKPKRKTRASIAKEKGLMPLAQVIMDTENNQNIEELAKSIVLEDKTISTEEKLKGASDILAEMFSENIELRNHIRKKIQNQGELESKVTSEWKDKRSKYEQYYDYKEKLNAIPSHRFLAIKRGEKEKILKTSVFYSDEIWTPSLLNFVYLGEARKDFIENALKDSLKRLLLPSLENEIIKETKDKSDEDAITIFAKNLEKLLLAPPAGALTTLAVDPGYRTGCKIVVLDETGKLLTENVIYPTKPLAKIKEAQDIVEELISKFDVKAVVIGNGTASKETKDFFKSFLPSNISLNVISEAGASVYSASDVAVEEFPNKDVTVRGAVSIGRRFQDPLSELVKIEAKSIGVGQYQHDVNQVLLKDKLDYVVVSAVNRVGVDVNRASVHLLKYVSGIGKRVAKNIVDYRNSHGQFKNREEIKNTPLLGDKIFQQSAGFLRVTDGENPLDKTGIHPESYFIVHNICEKKKCDIKRLMEEKDLLNTINPQEYIQDNFGLLTVKDIIGELKNPGRDPRDTFEKFEFEESIKDIDDLKEGMVLPGIITNVAKFGVFVDIGIHNDGLVHLSEIAHRFIKDPTELLSVGDTVKVKVIGIDKTLSRIQLSIKRLKEKPQKKRKNKKLNATNSLREAWGCK